MKPTTKLRARPSRPHITATTPKPTVEIAELNRGAIEALMERKWGLERALKETREARSSGEMATAIDTHLDQLTDFAIAMPPPGPAGTILVRVVGVSGKGGVEKVPLQNLEVHLESAGEILSQGRTDTLGLVRLTESSKAVDTADNAGTPLPIKDKAEKKAPPIPSKLVNGRAAKQQRRFEVKIYTSDCQLAGCDTFTDQDEYAARLIELGRTDALFPYFQKAEPWALAAHAATAKAAELKQTTERALAGQEITLVAAIAEIDKVIEKRRKKQ